MQCTWFWVNGIGNWWRYFLFLNQGENTLINENTEVNNTTNDQLNVAQGENDTISKKIKFEQNKYNNTSDFEYTTSYNDKLSKFKFVFAGNEWSYIEIKKTGIMKFYKSKLDKFNLTEEEKNLLLKN